MRFSRAVGICMNDYKQITALNVNNSACIESAARIKTHKCALSLPFLSSSRMGFCILLHVFICYVHSYRGIQQNAVHKFNIALCQYKLSMNESQKHKHLFSHLKYYQCTMKSAKWTWQKKKENNNNNANNVIKMNITRECVLFL